MYKIPKFSGKDFIRNLLNKILKSPFFAGNSKDIYLLLSLGALAFIIVPADWGSEESLERNEIEYVLNIFTNSNEIVDLASSEFQSDYFREESTYLIIKEIHFLTSDFHNHPKCRPPPSI